jgi:hypothetical protein
MVFKKIGALILFTTCFASANEWHYSSMDATSIIIKEEIDGYRIKPLGSDSEFKSIGIVSNGNIKLFSRSLNINLDEKKLLQNIEKWNGIFNEKYHSIKLGNVSILNRKYPNLYRVIVTWPKKGEYLVYYDLEFGIVAFQKKHLSQIGSFFISDEYYGFPKKDKNNYRHP